MDHKHDQSVAPEDTNRAVRGLVARSFQLQVAGHSEVEDELLVKNRTPSHTKAYPWHLREGCRIDHLRQCEPFTGLILVVCGNIEKEPALDYGQNH